MCQCFFLAWRNGWNGEKRDRNHTGKQESSKLVASEGEGESLGEMLGVAVNNQSGGDGWAKTLIILGVRLRFMVGET